MDVLHGILLGAWVLLTQVTGKSAKYDHFLNSLILGPQYGKQLTLEIPKTIPLD
jgi:hypothetical protein